MTASQSDWLLGTVGGWAICGEGTFERAGEGVGGGIGDEPGVSDDLLGG
ncbi:MAG: hypothetical protein ABEH88_00085 [Halobacteriales archaeon]